jgi:metal-responsive CopG/Arc/MetJ family transcriptional regulator
MKTLSLKLDEDIFDETEEILKEKKVARNRYINEALEFYNKFQKRKKLAAEFQKATGLAKESSLEIIAEFDALIGDEAV